MLSPQIIEKLTLIAPLGLRFRDAATGVTVGDGLSVWVYAAHGQSKRPSQAFPNRNGIYVLHRAGILQNLPEGTSEEEFWENSQPGKPFVVKVFDDARRFQPFQFIVNLPVRGVYQWETSIPLSPPGSGISSSIPLYSAPTRNTMGGMGVVRADLWDAEAESTAAFAVLEIRFEGRLVGRGIADRGGKLAIIFPQLPPNAAPLGSPPVQTGALALAKQSWKLNLSVKYQPSRFAVGSPPAETNNESELPDLRVVLAQNGGKIWAESNKSEELTEVTLRYGEELILRTRTAVLSPPDSANVSKLLVSPA